jgi:metal transporter CNNM
MSSILYFLTIRSKEEEGEEKIPFGTEEFWLYVLYSLFFTCVAGLMSGLTVGYNGINMLEINAIETADITPDDENYEEIQKKKKLIKKIKVVLSKRHLLLVTLLLTNAIAMEALPIFLDALMPAYVAIILSTTAVLIFGEVLPQVSKITKRHSVLVQTN